MSNQYGDTKDEFGIPVQQFVDTSASLGEAMKTRMRKRTMTATTNYLYLAGIPSTPAELLSFAEFVTNASVVSAIVDGQVTLNPDEVITDEERAQAAEMHEQRRALADLFNQGAAPQGGFRPGTYL